MREKFNTEKIPLPFSKLTINIQLDILKALVDWYEKNKEAVSYKDIGGIHASKPNVSSALQFYAEVGWIKREKKGYFLPSEDLIQFYKGIHKEKPTRNLIKKLVDTPVGKEILFFVEQKQPVDKKEIIQHVGGKFNLLKKDEKSILRFLELLLELGALKIDENGKIILLGGYQPEEELEELETPESHQESRRRISEEMFLGNRQIILAIGINVSPDTPEDKIREIVRIIIDELKREGGDNV